MIPVRITPAAHADIEAIATFIARSSIDRAIDFSSRVHGRIENLGIFPTRYQPRPELGARMRSFWEAPVTICYSVASDESEVVVIRVIAGGRDVSQQFGTL